MKIERFKIDYLCVLFVGDDINIGLVVSFSNMYEWVQNTDKAAELNVRQPVQKMTALHAELSTAAAVLIPNTVLTYNSSYRLIPTTIRCVTHPSLISNLLLCEYMFYYPI
jgi:hypothetical protein